MHSLKVIKSVSADAMDDDDLGAEGLFRSLVGPTTVLEMAEIIETLLQRLDETGADPKLVDAVKTTLRGVAKCGPS
jgi:hypothetical protein